MTHASGQDGDLPELRGARRFVFRWAPMVLLAEPFEAIFMCYGVVIGLGVINGAFSAATKTTPLYSVLGWAWALVWAAVFFAGSILIGAGLVHASRTVATKPRPIEATGLAIIGVALALYGLLAPWRLPHAQLTQVISMVLSEALILAWVIGIIIRIIIVTSPLGLLSVNRLNRVRLIKQSLKAGTL